MLPVLFYFIFQMGSHAYAQAGLRTKSSCLCLLSSWDYKHIPPCPAHLLSWPP
jgi:hypothetical protein